MPKFEKPFPPPEGLFGAHRLAAQELAIAQRDCIEASINDHTLTLTQLSGVIPDITSSDELKRAVREVTDAQDSLIFSIAVGALYYRGNRGGYEEEALRYERVIINTKSIRSN